MATQEFLKESLEHFKQQRAAKIEELRSLDITILQIQKQIGEAPVEQIEPYAALPISEPKQVGQSGGAYKPRPDEFFGMPQAEAAKTYLEKIGHAVSLDEILKAITGGGCKVGGADPKRTLSITISQGKREFVSTGGGNFGLRKFYSNLPKLGRPESPTRPKKKANGKRSGKKAAKRSPKPKAEVVVRAYDPVAVAIAVAEVLSDNQPKSPDEVIKAVEERVGFAVKKLAIYGVLRKKDFEQVGDKYRMRQPVEHVQVVQ